MTEKQSIETARRMLALSRKGVRNAMEVLRAGKLPESAEEVRKIDRMIGTFVDQGAFLDQIAEQSK